MLGVGNNTFSAKVNQRRLKLSHGVWIDEGSHLVCNWRSLKIRQLLAWVNLRTLHVSIDSLPLGYTMRQFTYLRLRSASLLRNQFGWNLLSLSFPLYSFYDLFCRYHLLKLSNVLRELRELLIFSIVHLNFFKVNLVLIFGQFKLIQVLQNKFFVCLFKLFHFDRVFSKLIEFSFNFLVELVGLCG